MREYESAKLARVTVTVPQALLRIADRRARQERRSRSWIFSESLRAWSASRAAKSAPAPYATELEGARLDRLTSDLALTPEERVLQAEEMARTAEIARPQPRVHQLLAFDTWEDYLAWKRRDVLR